MNRIPETQREAWDDIQESLSDRLSKVYAVICKNGGATLTEIASDLSWPINRVSGRVTELRKSGAVIDSGTRRTNPASGKANIVWQKNAPSIEGNQFVLPV